MAPGWSQGHKLVKPGGYLRSECAKLSWPTCSSLSRDSAWSRISEFPVCRNRPCLHTGTEPLVISMSIMFFFSEIKLQ